MLNKEQEKILTDTFGMNIEALKGALSSDKEEKIEFKSGTFMDEEVLTGLKETVKKQGYEDGKVAGVEMEAKAIKEKYKLEVEGKDFSKIFDVYGKKVISDAKIPVDKKLAESTESLAKLQKQYVTDLGLKDTEIQSLTQKFEGVKINTELQRQMPALKGVTPEQAVILANTVHSFGYDEGILVGLQNGKVLKDKMEKPIPVKTILTEFATKNGWFNVDGRGGENEGGQSGEFKSMNEVFDHMKKNDINPDSPEGLKLQTDFETKNK